MYNQWLPSSKDSTFMILKKQRQQKTDTKGLTVRHCNFFHVQIHCACQWIMTLPPKILWPTALLNTWNIITFPKSSFYHTNHTFLTNINVWMMDFSSINTRIKKISSAQNTILCREWLLQKLTFRHSEITIFNHSHNPTQRTFGEPQAPSVHIYIEREREEIPRRMLWACSVRNLGKTVRHSTTWVRYHRSLEVTWLLPRLAGLFWCSIVEAGADEALVRRDWICVKQHPWPSRGHDKRNFQ